MMRRRSLMLAAGSIDIADAFSTDLYTGTSAAQTITNGIDLAAEGGLVWTKRRDGSGSNIVFDSERSFSPASYTDGTGTINVGADAMVSFDSDGFSLGADSSFYVNYTGRTYVAWTFRKAPKFFDVVTYTGDGGSNRAIPHSLGIVPGMVIVKRTDGGAENWSVDHRGLVQGSPLFLNLTQASVSTGGTEFPTEPTDENFYVGTNNTQNGNTFEYVGYVFAHDTEDDSVIQCGSYTGNGSTTGPVVTLGWEPQWLLVKNAGAAASWWIHDTVRGVSSGLNPNTSGVETTGLTWFSIDATGFQITANSSNINSSGVEYIYMAIRKEGA
jgi:hypothetical protein